MKTWKKRDDSKTIRDVVLRNTGLTESELFGNVNYEIKGLDKACDIIMSFIKAKKPIKVVGDYDVDGIQASMNMFTGLKALGADVSVRLPRRISEGFGLSEKIIDEIETGLVITVDNGIMAFDAVKKAKDKGLTVIVTDHHLTSDDGRLPEADLIINPHIEGTADFNDYCGAGIAYKLCEYLLKDHVDKDKIIDRLAGYTSIATIADVVPLIKDNRNIVKKGFKNLMGNNLTTGLAALLTVGEAMWTKRDSVGDLKSPYVDNKNPSKEELYLTIFKDGSLKITTYKDEKWYRKDYSKVVEFSQDDIMEYSKLQEPKLVKRHIDEGKIGYKFGPIINASGRLYDEGAIKVMQVIGFDGHWMRAAVLATELIKTNEERKALSTIYMERVRNNISSNNLIGDIPMCIYEPGLSEGLVGIVAGQIAEEYKTPCFMFTDSEKPGFIKGSARSYGDVDLAEILNANKSLINENDGYFGGHAEAAGITIRKDFFELFRQSLIDVTVMENPEDADTVYYDLEISIKDIPKCIEELEVYAPYGNTNPNPIFFVTDFEVYPRFSELYKLMSGGKHIKLFGQDLDAVGFDLANKYLELDDGKSLKLIGNLSVNRFLNKVTNQVELIDLKSNKTKKTPLAIALEQRVKEKLTEEAI